MSQVSVARGQELKVLHLENMHTEHEKVTLHITERTKTWRKIITFPKYDLSENLDVTSCLESYILVTRSKRDKDDDR